jgi:hypothetical protein
MDDIEFEQLEETFRSSGAPAVFELLIRRACEEKNHRVLFGARVMEVRHRLGLPLIETQPTLDVRDEQRSAYETAFRDAAREAGELCLAAGDIVSAWPYFKAIGESAPVAAAIEDVTAREDLDRVIEIAFQEGVNPRKGFELILKHHGICSAITWFGSNRDYDSRQASLRLLVQTLHSQLTTALRETIAATEGRAPDTTSVRELVAGRDWLFEGTSYYVDSTHLASVLRYAPELEDAETLRMALDMADYGQRLNPMFHFRGEPPFEDIYLDHAVYLRALLGEEVDAAIAHFRSKVNTPGDTTPAEVLIDLLIRLGRHAEAIQASIEYLPNANAGSLSCPSVVQLCQMVGDYSTLRTVARDRADLLSFAAALIQSP